MPDEYKIEGLDDISALPDDRLEAFAAELPRMVRYAKGHINLLNAIAEDTIGTKAVGGSDYWVWVDDGKDDVDVHCGPLPSLQVRRT